VNRPRTAALVHLYAPPATRAPGRGRTGVSRASALALVAGAVAGLLSGCSGDLSRIDARVDRVVSERSGLLGRDTRAPRREAGDPGATARRGMRDTDPETRNPDAAALRFEPSPPPAPTAREEASRLSDRLSAYALESLGETSGPPDPDALLLDLPSAFRLTQESGREFLNAEEEYVLAAIRLLIERHRWSPRLFNDTTVSFAGSDQPGGFRSSMQAINTLRATQRLPWGGEVEARWVARMTDELRRVASGRYTESSELILGANVPLLRGAGAVAREDIIQAERNLIYQARTFERFRRSYLVDIATDYFDLIQTQARIDNQVRQLRSLEELEVATSARVEAGRLSEFERNLAASRVLQARADLAGLREQFILRLDRFKVRLGLPVERKVAIVPLSFDIPTPADTLEDATATALDLRLDLQNRRDQLDDSRRAVANAKNNLLPSLNLNLEGRVGEGERDNRLEGGTFVQPDEPSYSAGATLSLPLDREIERLQLRQAMIALEQRERSFAEARDNVAVSVRSALRNIELARFQLTLAEQRVEINRRRLEEQQLKSDIVQPQDLVDTNNDLLQSENERDQALTNLRTAVLNYLLETDQLRVERDGTFLALPGMDAAPSSVPPAPRPGGADDTPLPALAPAAPTPGAAPPVGPPPEVAPPPEAAPAPLPPAQVPPAQVPPAPGR
jgi:outer membrane protein TolC